MIPKLLGSGSLLLGEKRLVAGDFTISHDLSQSNGLVVEFIASGDEAAAFEGKVDSADGPEIERNLTLKGTTQHSQPVRVDKLLLGNRNLSRDAGKSLHTRLTLLPRDALLVGTEPRSVGRVRFFIPNVVFGGMACTPKAGGGFKRDTVLIETQLNGRPVQIRLQQLPDYVESRVRLGQSTSSAWTAKLDVSSLGEAELTLDEARAVADDFLLLLSFALSRRVMWVVMKAMDPGVTYRQVRYGTAMNLKAFPGSVMGDGHFVAGLGGRARHPLTEFLEAALPAYWALAADARELLREAIECMCESLQGFFSPAAVALAGRAFEGLCDAFLSQDQRYYTYKTEAYDLTCDLKERLIALAAAWRRSDAAAADEWEGRLDGHVRGLLRRRFKLQLITLLDETLTKTGNPYDQAWANQFVAARNSAAHYAPVEEKEATAWVKGMSLLSCTILKLLGYSGPYVSFYGDGASEAMWAVLR